MIRPTKRQKEILTFIESFIDEQGYPPIIADLQDEFRFGSPNTAADHVRRMMRNGLLVVTPPRRPLVPHGMRFHMEP